MYNEPNIILDFDGTIFKLFENHSLDRLIKRLYNLTNVYNIGFTEQNDAFDAFALIRNSDLSDDIKRDLLVKAHMWATEEELEALKTGVLVDGFFEFLKTAPALGKKIAIATNNSPECIERFFESLAPNIITEYNIPVIGREALHTERMKPSPYMLRHLCETNGWDAADTLYIGDHPRDWECAVSFGCRFIGMASAKEKRDRFLACDASMKLVSDYRELVSLLLN
ncbi:MAG: HAD hydrolase-like protein [Clostridia bacterium]|nr:HAD hydrolase-like protein [Clostridia bacterium]